MGVLEQVTQMKNKGMSENQIISNLQEKGISPKAINDALNQSQIKSAVSPNNSNTPEEESMSGSPYNQYDEDSMGSSDTSNPESYENYDKNQEGGYGQTQYPSPQQYPQQQSYSEEYYPQPQQEYSDYSGYSDNYGYGNSDNIIEVSEQVFSEKIKTIKKQIEELKEFKSIYSVKIDNAVERLKRIESSMDKLQMAILDKVGAYGNTLESIKREMSMMQDSFGKVLPNLAEKHKSHSSSTRKKTPQTKSHSKK